MVQLGGFEHTSEELDKGGGTAGEPPPAYVEAFYQRLQDRSARIGVIGLGYSLSWRGRGQGIAGSDDEYY